MKYTSRSRVSLVGHVVSTEHEPITGSGEEPPAGSRGGAPGQGIMKRKASFAFAQPEELASLYENLIY